MRTVHIEIDGVGINAESSQHECFCGKSHLHWTVRGTSDDRLQRPDSYRSLGQLVAFCADVLVDGVAGRS